MKAQAEISLEKLKQKIGKTYDILIEDYTEDGKYLISRNYMDIPNEDGVVYIENSSNKEIIIGEFYQCMIDDIPIIEEDGNKKMSNYDLIGHII